MTTFLRLCTLACMFLAAPFSLHAQQLFFDDFEGGAMTRTENGVKWGGGAYTSIVSNFGRSGTRSLRFAFQAGDNSWAEQRFNLGKDYTDVTIEWYAYYPSGSDGMGPKFVHKNNASQGDNNKLIRLWKGNASDGTDGYSSFYVKVGASSDLSSSGSGNESVYGEYGTNGKGIGPGGSTGAGPVGKADPLITDAYRGRWVPFKYRVKTASSANNDGLMELWRDGVLLFRNSQMPIYPSGGTGNGFNIGYLLGWANSGFAQTTYVYIDDVRISSGATTQKTPNSPTSVTAE